MLEPKAILTVRAAMVGTLPVPGVHTIEVGTTVTDSKARVPRPQGARFRFELRVPSSEDRSEVARRGALRAFLAGNYQSAEGLANDLLAANASSHVGYVILGDIAAARGNASLAIRNYETAVSLLVNRSDTMFLRWASQSHLDDSIVAIREKLAKVRTAP
jgi:hypothetical protein